MLQTLKIKNVALIKNLSLEFNSGFNVLLGETGAGKSIIIDSLNFVLGDKANKALIRTGETQMRVDASFTDYGSQTKKVLEDLGFEDEGVLLFSRTLTLDGKSECRVNGITTTVSMLKQITGTIVDTYGQHENQILLKSSNHLALLESYNPSVLKEEKLSFSVLKNELKELQNKKNEIGGSFENRERLLDLLSYQIEEIEAVAPKENEDEELALKMQAFSQSEKITDSLHSSLENFNTAGILSNIKSALHSLNSIEKYCPEITPLIERITSTMYELDDVAEELSKLSSNYIFSQAEMDKIDNRLDSLKSLKRKYGGSINQVLEFLDNAIKQKEELINAEETLKQLSLKEELIKEKLFNVANSLSIKRRQIASEVEERVLSELSDLGMKNSRFKIWFKNNPSNYKDDITYNSSGFDDVEFLFSANLGEDLKPLSKTISGGEMSRFMLAMKNILADSDGATTLIFDEVDTGISGVIGNAIAEKLARLAKKFQVLCITHLSQVSAMADNYIYVTKETINNSTETKTETLLGDRILQQIAQLTSGNNKTDTAINYAKELKANAELFKQKLK